jgi:tripartite-type tricarboxylate transporter receptor subunit TctC
MPKFQKLQKFHYNFNDRGRTCARAISNSSDCAYNLGLAKPPSGVNMKRPRRQILQLTARAAALAAVSVFLLAVAASDARSETIRTIKIIVPFPPGGAVDFLARLLAEEISRAGPAMVIENRPGAGAVIGTEAASRAPADGNTLLMVANSFVINPHLRKVNYDPLTSFEPICYLARSPTLLVVNSASPYRTFADLVAAARTKPGELTLASAGPATSFHIAAEILKRKANVNLTYVPFPGDPPAISALLGEHVTSVFANYATVIEHLNAGKLRALATGSRARIEPLPALPTFAESGYEDYEVENWFGIVAPAMTRKETVTQLTGWYTAALQNPRVKAKLAVQGLFPAAMCGADFAAHIRTRYDEYGRAIREANIKAD